MRLNAFSYPPLVFWPAVAEAPKKMGGGMVLMIFEVYSNILSVKNQAIELLCVRAN
jgi:hypothetical protein